MTKGHRRRCFRGLFLVFICVAPLTSPSQGQDKGEPGKFDFYLMNAAWGPQFCGVPGAGPQCKPPHGFVLHGLWTQFSSGQYPVFCSTEPGPKDLTRYLDLTPDLPLLQHEWDKHGTCSAAGPERFFRMERQAFHSLRIPARFEHVAADTSLATAEILADFHKVNPAFPDDGILLSCAKGKLTAVEACFSKDLKPMRCQGLRGCEDRTIVVEADAALP